jgi:amidohydrolase
MVSTSHDDHPLADAIRTMVREELPSLVEFRRDLHMHPEVGYEEVRTSGAVLRELAARGIAHVGGLAGGTGILAHVPGRAARAVALRADMDALPIAERGDRPWKSRIDGRMHACGHDGHTAILLGTARILARLAAQAPLPRPVTLVFQPAEEGGGGGKRMVEEGALTGARIGAPAEEAFALHGWPDLALGSVATRRGAMMAASDRFEVHVEGRGSHAAWPHRSADPVVCAAAIVTAMQQIVSRNVDPLDAAVISITVIESGSAFNVIPDRATLKGTYRSLSEETRAMLERRMAEVAEGTARAHGCTARCDFHRGYPVTMNDDGAVARFEDVARRTLGAARVSELAAPVMGGEDFAFFGPHVPCCYWALGLAPGGRPLPPLHAPDFDFNDDAIAVGVEVMCRLAVREPIPGEALVRKPGT